MAARSATRTGWSFTGGRLTMADPRWMRSVASRAVADEHLARREVAVLGEGVVLAEPRVLPVVLVGEDRVLGLAHQRGVLRPGVVRSGAGDVAVEKDAELHEVSLRGYMGARAC